MRTSLSVVVDSNVWISALVFGGNPRRVFETIIRQGMILVISAEIISETNRILASKFPEFQSDFQDFLSILKPRISEVQLGSININICRDQFDNFVLETAVLGKATIIISGDNDLLSLKNYQGITIKNSSQLFT